MGGLLEAIDEVWTRFPPGNRVHDRHGLVRKRLGLHGLFWEYMCFCPFTRVDDGSRTKKIAPGGSLRMPWLKKRMDSPQQVVTLNLHSSLFVLVNLMRWFVVRRVMEF
jgi:hypothetical protein